jgi:hypothetical protein
MGEDPDVGDKLIAEWQPMNHPQGPLHEMEALLARWRGDYVDRPTVQAT